MTSMLSEGKTFTFDQLSQTTGVISIVRGPIHVGFSGGGEVTIYWAPNGVDMRVLKVLTSDFNETIDTAGAPIEIVCTGYVATEDITVNVGIK